MASHASSVAAFWAVHRQNTADLLDFGVWPCCWMHDLRMRLVIHISLHYEFKDVHFMTSSPQWRVICVLLASNSSLHV